MTKEIKEKLYNAYCKDVDTAIAIRKYNDEISRIDNEIKLLEQEKMLIQESIPCSLGMFSEVTAVSSNMIIERCKKEENEK